MRNCYDIFDDRCTFMHYDGKVVDAIYFNPNGGYKGKGSFVENTFTIDYLLELNLEDIIDLHEYIFNDDSRKEYIYDFGQTDFASILADIFDSDNHWITFGSFEEVSAFLIGIIEANRRK